MQGTPPELLKVANGSLDKVLGKLSKTGGGTYRTVGGGVNAEDMEGAMLELLQLRQTIIHWEHQAALKLQAYLANLNTGVVGNPSSVIALLLVPTLYELRPELMPEDTLIPSGSVDIEDLIGKTLQSIANEREKNNS